MVVRRWVAALLMVPMLVSCSDDEPTAHPGPTHSSSASETKTATGPVEPVMPEAAKKPTKAGAVAFVKHYWDVVHFAEVTGTVSPLRSLSGPGCTRCLGGIGGLSQIFANGGRIVSQPRTITIGEVRLAKSGVLRVAFVTATIRGGASTIFYGPGDSRNREQPGGKRKYQFALAGDKDGGWRLDQWIDAS